MKESIYNIEKRNHPASRRSSLAPLMESNGFEILTCPTCYGKINFNENVTTLRCENCKNMFLIRKEDGNTILDLIVPCPVCHQFDRVEKASRVSERGGLENFLHPPIRPERPEYPDPVIDNPEPPKDTIVVALPVYAVCGGLMIGLFCGLLDASFAIGIISAALSGAAIYYVGNLYVTFMRSEDSPKLEDNQENFPRIESYPVQFKHWQKAMANWNQLYYCYRDECVFIPGTDQFTRIEKTQFFLYGR